jgi:hypothetical protein
LYDFVRKCDSFEVIHNDRTVFKAADLIHANFNTPQP